MCFQQIEVFNDYISYLWLNKISQTYFINLEPFNVEQNMKINIAKTKVMRINNSEKMTIIVNKEK